MIPEREMPPQQVMAEFRRWEDRMRSRKEADDAITAFWETRYWTSLTNIKNTGRFSAESDEGSEWIEVNRIGAYVTGYQAALHDPRMKVKIGPDPQGRGNHKYVNHLVNQWLIQTQTVAVTHEADQMAIMRPGVGYFTSFDETNPDVLARVELKAVPWRSLIVDHDVESLNDQRFIGRCVCVPLVTARRMFRDQTIQGRPRPADMGAAAYTLATDPIQGAGSVDRIVRVVSIINFKDPYYMGESDLTTGKLVEGFVPHEGAPGVEATPSTVGRMEWYLPDERLPDVPRMVMPVATRDMSGRVVSPLTPLCYLTRDGAPLQGMSHVERVLDAFRETCIIRSREATALRKDCIQYLVPEGLLDDKAEGQVRRSVWAAFLTYKPEDLKGRSIADLVSLMPTGNMVYQHQSYQNVVDADIQGSKIQAPSQTGQISDGSATEVINAIQTGTSEIEMLRTKKRGALERAIRSFICMLGASMAAAGGGTTIKAQIDGVDCEVSRLDLMGDFKIEIEAGESSTQEEQRALQAFLMFAKAAEPLMAAVVKGDEVAATILDELVTRAKMPPKFLSENVKRLARVEEEPVIPNGPGADSALPGQGSIQPTIGSGPETTAGGPQPNPEQPIDNQTGVAQNGVATA